jgi:hypothetical protein
MANEVFKGRLLKDGCMLGKVKNRGCGVEEKLFCF